MPLQQSDLFYVIELILGVNVGLHRYQDLDAARDDSSNVLIECVMVFQHNCGSVADKTNVSPSIIIDWLNNEISC